MSLNFLLDQTDENNCRIDAFQRIDVTYGFQGTHCKYPSTINKSTLTLNVDDYSNENDVNYETMRI